MSLDVVGVLSPYLRFGHYGEGVLNVPAHCPFHERSRRPTLYVYIGPATDTKFPGAAFCFKCNEGWSLHGLLRKLAAPTTLIDQVKAHLERVSTPRTGPTALIDLTMDTLPEALLGAFEFIPKKLLEEGFTRETIHKHELGFDRFKKRIIFPIRNHHGQLVAVSGRATRDYQQARYKVYTQQDLGLPHRYAPPKGKVLWGLDKFYETRLQNPVDLPPVVVCEGFKAKLWVEQAGYPHSVALMGTWFTKTQLFLLQCISSSIIMLLDNDAPGIEAANKQAERLITNGLDISFGNYNTTNEISPDDLSANEVNNSIKNSLSLRAWRNFYDLERPPLRQERQ